MKKLYQGEIIPGGFIPLYEIEIKGHDGLIIDSLRATCGGSDGVSMQIKGVGGGFVLPYDELDELVKIVEKYRRENP